MDSVELVFDGQHHALTDIQLHCEAGDFVSIVGPSGCGKSTLLRLMSGLIAPTKGLVRTEQRAGDDLTSDAAPTVGFVFQQANLLPWLNVLDNVALPLKLAGESPQSQQTAATRAREWVGLSEADESKWPRQLSGGMQMRVAVARALVARPDLLLMDEPFAAVDDLLRSRLNEEIVALWQQQKWTAVFVTHNVAEAVFVSQRVLVMSQAPGTIATSIPVPFDYPRTSDLRGTPEFAALTHQVATALRDASDARSPS